MVQLLPARRLVANLQLRRPLRLLADRRLAEEATRRSEHAHPGPPLPPWLEDQRRRNRDVPALQGQHRALPLPRRTDPDPMVERNDNRITRTSGMTTWRAGCGGSRTSGSEGGPEKPTSRKADRALRSDPHTKPAGLHTSGRGLHLYVILDVYSRYAVGDRRPRETARLAEEPIADAIHRQRVPDGQPLHARRPRHLDDLQDCVTAPRRPRRPTVPQPPTRLQRQPLQRSKLQASSSTSPRFPKRSANSPIGLAPLVDFFDHYNHHHPTPARDSTHRPMSTTAAPNLSVPNAKPCSTPPTPPTLTDSDDPGCTTSAGIRRHV